MYTFMNAQAYCTTCKNATSSIHIQRMHTRCMHDPHKKHSSCTHATLTCITYATYSISHPQVCWRHAKDTHCVHIAFKPHATHACVHATLILHMSHAHYCHSHSTYLFCIHALLCMHAHYTHICRLLLHHVNLMQNTCKHFLWMHKLMLHSHKPFTCTLHTSTLHPHTMPLASRTCVSLLCAFRMCLCAWQYSCMDHVLV
jgi:hypothetical protein